MTMRQTAVWRGLMACLITGLLAACGGGGGEVSDGGGSAPASCSVADQNAWLRGYMADWYFWYALSPSPDPLSYSSVDSYFNALLYPGGTAPFPADRWSYTQPSAEHELFFGEGRELGYGLFVAGLEVAGHPDQPLRVRYVEPLSPAASGGVLRGDEIVSVNGQAASTLIASGDYSVLTPQASGDQLQLVLRDAAGATRNVTLGAAIFTLTPVTNAEVVDTGSGRRTGYLVLKDFIDQAVPALENAFSSFQAAGIDDLVIDLRYNGGGLVTTADTLASYVGGGRTSGQVFASLLYNDRHADQNTSFQFASLASALGVSRVYVLTGQRTCSASELVVNGLRPFIQVVTIGDTTCGKPVGFQPISRCGTTFSAVNFESVNARNEGRYFDGFAPTCAVADDLDHALGSPSEALLAAARTHASTGACPAGTMTSARIQGFRGTGSRPLVNEGEHGTMIVR
jgi:hypothetical protein